MADAGWYPDPSGTHEQRYYDGAQWTEYVSNGGVTGQDPVPAPAPVAAVPFPTVAQDSWPNVTAAKPVTRWPLFVGLGVLVVAVIAAIALRSGGDDDPDRDITVATTATTPGSSPASTEDSPETTTADELADTPTGNGSSRDDPLPPGTAATIDNYEVTIVGFTEDATAQIMQDNQFNDPPDDGFVYSLIRVRATYLGDEEGYPGFDLSVGYAGSDSRLYVDHECLALVPDSLLDQGEVLSGGTVEGNLCLHLPASVVGSGAIFVESFISFDDEKVWWAGS